MFLERGKTRLIKESLQKSTTFYKGFWFWLIALAPVVVVHNRSFFFWRKTMKKFYKINLDCVSMEFLDLNEVTEILGVTGSFNQKDGDVWELRSSDSEIFFKALELICCFSYGFSDDDYKAMKNNPDGFFEVEMAA